MKSSQSKSQAGNKNSQEPSIDNRIGVDKGAISDKKPGKIAGLMVRQKAALALGKVLSGEVFEPLDASVIDQSRDRALANRLITVALRRHGHLNHIITALLERGIPKRSGSFEAILRIALAQLLFLPDLGEHSAIHLAVECARLDKRAGRFDKLLNGVLRQAQREGERWRNLNNDLLFPVWLTRKWRRQYGDQAFEKFGEALLSGASLDVTLKENDGELISQLGGKVTLFDNVRILQRDKTVSQLPGYENGLWWVQDAAAAIPARLFGLPAGARILDMCAAPGGKAAQLVKAGYKVTALDRSGVRLKRMEANFKRLNYQVEAIEADGIDYCAKERFDGVLIDAPCTASGVFRRHPEVIWQRSEEDIKGRVLLQRKLISNGVNCLKTGGELILCVCSMHFEEGESQIEWVLHNFPQLELVPIKLDELGGLKGALSAKGGVRTHAGLGLPAFKKGTLDGFFVARWRVH